MGLSLHHLQIAESEVELREDSLTGIERPKRPEHTEIETYKQHRCRVTSAHTVHLQYTPTRRLAATIRGVSILGPRVSPGVYRIIFWADAAKRKRIITLLFTRYLLGESYQRFTYRRKRRYIRMDCKLVGWRVRTSYTESYGGMRDQDLLPLLNDVVRIHAKRSWAIVKKSK